MRQGGPGVRRPRGRHGSNNNGGNGGQPGGGRENRVRSAASLRHQTFDSNGPDVRVRGNAWQVYEKYQSLARDATGAGDRVMAENYLQHAEHYYRIIEAIEEATAAEQRQRGGGAGAPFGNQQPDVPANYFTPDGQLSAAQPAAPVVPGQGQQPMMAQPSAQPDGAAMPQAEVQRKNPPPAASPFFTTDDADDADSGPQTLVAQR